MSKAPLTGMVKTRLVPPLTHAQAAALSVNFLRDITQNIARLAESDDVEGIVVYTPAGAEATFDGLLPEGFKLLPQREGSLGDRLLKATEDLLAHGYKSVCLINSDSPTLPRAMLSAALTSLARPGDRVVLGQCTDGGYYLIGLKRAHPSLFEGIAWSTSNVLAQTIERAGEIALEVELLPAWYDVDDEHSLRRLCEELFTSPGRQTRPNGACGYKASHTRRYLARFIEEEGRERIWPNGRRG